MMELSQNIPTIKIWTFKKKKKYAENKYRERYINYELSTKVISPYEYEDLIQNDNEKKHSTFGSAIKKNVKVENIEVTYPKKT